MSQNQNQQQKPQIKKLNFINIAALYVGTLMGAGFASGREGWQFFGVFVPKGYMGLAIATFFFIVLGMMISYIAIEKGTDDVGTIIVGEKHPTIAKISGISISLMLYPVIISMSAAGGAFLNQQFGIHRAIGAVIIIGLVIFTLLGDFARVSKIFKRIVPLLFVIDVVLCIIVSFSDIKQSGATSGFSVSTMAPNWIIAAFIFVSYNIIAMVPILGTSAINAKDKKHAISGSALGGLFLGVLTLVLVIALCKDMAFSNSLDLPMLAYSARISKLANFLFGGVLFAAIYSAATSVFYGFTVMIPEGPRKKPLVVISALFGFIGSLTGFKAIVSFLYPFEGYIGFVLIAFLIKNFFDTFREKRKERLEKMTEIRHEHDSDIYASFDNHDRFAYPEYLERVTAGFGGEAILIFGKEKTALYDCGMAYCHKELISNIKAALNKHFRNTLEYVVISHSHYDHMGALPYILDEFPNAIVCGAAKAKSVFEGEGAKRTMKRLGEAARDTFTYSKEEIKVDGLRIDRVVKEGDKIELGSDEYLYVLETKGHTDCSLTYVLEPESLMFASESTGVLRKPEYMNTAFLKSYSDTIDAAKKCLDYKPKHLIGAHYGIVPDFYIEEYFNLYIRAAEYEKNFILDQHNKGLNHDEIMKAFEEEFWSDERSRAQPKEAFLENAKYTIKLIVDTFGE